MSFSPKQQRWYDQNPAAKKMMSIIEEFPPHLQTLSGELLLAVLDPYWDSMRYSSTGKELGAQGQLNFIKSQQKRRWYDQHVNLRKAINRLASLPDSARNPMVERMGLGFELMDEYFHMCINERIPVQLEELKTLYTLATTKTPEEAKTHLQYLLPLPPEPEPVLPKSVILHDKVRQDDSGMKISFS